MTIHNSLASCSKTEQGPTPLTGSIRFNNSNSYTYFGSPITLSSAFTIEFWANIPAPGNGTFQGYVGISDNLSIGWDFGGNGKWTIVRNGTTGFTSTTTSTNAKLGWQHIAAQRNSSGIFTIYIDGVLAFTSTASTGTLGGSNGWVLGRSSWSNNTNYVQGNGRMTRLRISNVVRYSANFTPPTTNLTHGNNTFHVFNFKTSSNYLTSETGSTMTNVNSTFQAYP